MEPIEAMAMENTHTRESIAAREIMDIANMQVSSSRDAMEDMVMATTQSRLAVDITILEAQDAGADRLGHSDSFLSHHTTILREGSKKNFQIKRCSFYKRGGFHR